MRKGLQSSINRLFSFPFFGDGLKIPIKVLDTDLDLFILFFAYLRIQTRSVSSWSQRIFACEEEKKEKKEN